MVAYSMNGKDEIETKYALKIKQADLAYEQMQGIVFGEFVMATGSSLFLEQVGVIY